MCLHDITSGRTNYDRQAERLTFLRVCDGCDQELERIEGPEYKPNFVPGPPLNKRASP